MDTNTASCAWSLVVAGAVAALGLFVLPMFFKHGPEKTPTPVLLAAYVDPRMDAEPRGAAGGMIWTLMMLLMLAGIVGGIGALLGFIK